MPHTNGRPHGSTNHCASGWAFSDAVAREQHALETLKQAQPEFARAIARALLPDPARDDRDVLRSTR